MGLHMFAPNGPGFKGLYAGDVISFRRPQLHRDGGAVYLTATVAPLLVSDTHVVVNYRGSPYVVNEYNFFKLVRRGKRHIAADKERTGFETLPYVRAADAARQDAKPDKAHKGRCAHCGALPEYQQHE